MTRKKHAGESLSRRDRVAIIVVSVMVGVPVGVIVGMVLGRFVV